MADKKIILKSLSSQTGNCSCVCGVAGCRSLLAKNYDPAATKDDGSCINPCGCKMGNFIPASSGNPAKYEYETPCVMGENGLYFGYCPGGEEPDRFPYCCEFGKAPCNSVSGCTGATGSTFYNYCQCMPVGCPEGAADLTFNVAVGSCTTNQTKTISCATLHQKYIEADGFEGIDVRALLDMEDICFAQAESTGDNKYSPIAAPLLLVPGSEDSEGCESCYTVDPSDPENPDKFTWDDRCLTLRITYSDPSYPTESEYAQVRCCNSLSLPLGSPIIEEICKNPPTCTQKVYKIIQLYTGVKTVRKSTYTCGTTCLFFDCDQCTASPCSPP